MKQKTIFVRYEIHTEVKIKNTILWYATQFKTFRGIPPSPSSGYKILFFTNIFNFRHLISPDGRPTFLVLLPSKPVYKLQLITHIKKPAVLNISSLKNMFIPKFHTKILSLYVAVPDHVEMKPLLPTKQNSVDNLKFTSILVTNFGYSLYSDWNA